MNHRLLEDQVVSGLLETIPTSFLTSKLGPYLARVFSTAFRKLVIKVLSQRLWILDPPWLLCPLLFSVLCSKSGRKVLKISIARVISVRPKRNAIQSQAVWNQLASSLPEALKLAAKLFLRLNQNPTYSKPQMSANLESPRTSWTILTTKTSSSASYFWNIFTQYSTMKMSRSP